MPSRGPILALDISSKTGWCCGRPCANEQPAGGVWRLGRMKDAQGRLQLGYLNSCIMAQMEAVIEEHQPEMVVFEQPIVKQQTTARMLTYLAGAVETACFENGRIPCYEAAAPTARKHMLGFSRKKNVDIKAAVMAWCRARGLDYVDDNHADALLLWHYACEITLSKVVADRASIF